jgi:hypothetical protein
MLTLLPRGQSKPKVVSEGNDPIHDILRYLGPAGSEQRNILELIRGKVLDSPTSCSHFRMQNTHFATKLLKAFTSVSGKSNMHGSVNLGTIDARKLSC